MTATDLLGAVQPLGVVRRLEAAGFRAMPAGRTVYDRTWAIRLTPGHPSKRVNSVNPLDPADSAQLAARIADAGRVFAGHGLPSIFRLGPLSGKGLDDTLAAAGYGRCEDTLVMTCNAMPEFFPPAIDRLPIRDLDRWARANAVLKGGDHRLAAMIAETIEKCPADCGLFLIEDDGEPAAVARCVVDGNVAGIFEMRTGEQFRRRGHAASIFANALKWGFSRGARIAWLQVEADNLAAIALYEKAGFSEAYRYWYRIRRS